MAPSNTGACVSSPGTARVDWETLVINNSSSDDTSDVVVRFRSALPIREVIVGACDGALVRSVWRLAQHRKSSRQMMRAHQSLNSRREYRRGRATTKDVAAAA